MRKLAYLVWLFATLNFHTISVISQEINTAFPFLNITPDARGGSMGETGAGTRPDAFSTYWNAAKAAYATNQLAFGISYTPWMRALRPDNNFIALGGYFRPDSSSAFCAMLRYFSFGNVNYIMPSSIVGQFRPNEYSLDGSYCKKILKNISVGIAGRYLASNLFVSGIAGNHLVKAIAFDAGLFCQDYFKLKTKTGILRYGISIVNAGPKIDYDTSSQLNFMPVRIVTGGGIELKINSNNRIATQYELSKFLVPIYGNNNDISAVKGLWLSFYDAPGGMEEELREINVGVGVEYIFKELFFLRAGYYYQDPSKGNMQYLTTGLGIKYNVFGLDFSYLIPKNIQRHPLQNTLRFTLTFNLEELKS